jgi:hypothetical protein
MVMNLQRRPLRYYNGLPRNTAVTIRQTVVVLLLRYYDAPCCFFTYAQMLFFVLDNKNISIFFIELNYTK